MVELNVDRCDSKPSVLDYCWKTEKSGITRKTRTTGITLFLLILCDIFGRIE